MRGNGKTVGCVHGWLFYPYIGLDKLFEAVDTGRDSGETGDEKNKKGENLKYKDAKKTVFHNNL